MESTDKAHVIQGLKINEEYTLHEDTAPVGYDLAQAVEFTIKDTGEIQKVKMEDHRKLNETVKTGADNQSYIEATLYCYKIMKELIDEKYPETETE